MKPELVESWLRVARDLGALVGAMFLLGYGTIRVHEPTALAIVLGTGAGLLGTPMFLRLDSRRRDSNTSNEGEP
jgi:hypothetical protein